MSNQFFYCYPLTYEGGSAYSGAANVGNIDDTYGAWDDDATYVEASYGSLAGAKEGRWYFTPFVPFATAIVAVTLGIRGRRSNPGVGGSGIGVDQKPAWKVGGSSYYGSVNTPTGGFLNNEDRRTTNPFTTLAWQVSEMPGRSASPFSGGAFSQATSVVSMRHRLTGVWLTVEYQGLGSLTEQVRDARSRQLWDWRKAKGFITTTVPIHMGLEVWPGDLYWLEHFAGAPAGWLARAFELKRCFVYGRRVNPADGTVELMLRDTTSHVCLSYDSMWTPRSSSALGVGIARFNTGQVRNYERVGSTYILDPGSKLIVKRIDNEPLYTDGGQAFMEAETNYLIQSGFKNGTSGAFTGWTKNGTTADATIDTQATYLKWDGANTGVLQAPIVTASIPIGGADLELVGTATASFGANTNVWALAGYQNLTSGPAYIAYQRGVDSKWWRESDQSWQVAKTWNPLPVYLTPSGLWDHYCSKRIALGAGATTLTVQVGVPTTGVAGTTFVPWWLKITDAIDPTPFPILTETVTVTVPATRLRVSNTIDMREVCETQGALVFEGITFWNSADIGSTFRTALYHANADGSLALWGGYDGANARWFFSLTAGGSTVTAFKAATVVRGVMQRIVFRWTGSNAEQPTPGVTLAAYTASVIVDGVKGTDASIPAGLRDQVLPTLEIGSKAAAQRFGGILRLYKSLQRVPTDLEAARLT